MKNLAAVAVKKGKFCRAKSCVRMCPFASDVCVVMEINAYLLRLKDLAERGDMLRGYL